MSTIVNIADPHNKGSRIVGYRFEEGSEIWGDYGLSEPVTWFQNRLNSGIKSHDGQKLLIQFILDKELDLSEDSRKILQELIK